MVRNPSNTTLTERITPAGVVTEFSAGISAENVPGGITAGADGNLWFTEQVGNRIGRITPAGVVSEFRQPQPFGSVRLRGSAAVALPAWRGGHL